MQGKTTFWTIVAAALLVIGLGISSGLAIAGVVEVEGNVRIRVLDGCPSCPTPTPVPPLTPTPTATPTVTPTPTTTPTPTATPTPTSTPTPTATPTSTPTPTPTPTPQTIAYDGFEVSGFNGGTGWLGGWSYGSEASVRSSDSPHAGNYHVRLRDNTGDILRSVNLANWHDVKLSLWAKVDDFEAGDRVDLWVTHNGSDWTLLRSWTNADPDKVYQYFEFSLSGLPMTSNFSITFDGEMSSTGDKFLLDEVRLVGYHN